MPQIFSTNRRLPCIALAGALVLCGVGGVSSPVLASDAARNSFADLAESQIDTVVNISTRQATPTAAPTPNEEAPGVPGGPQFPPGSPFEEFFRQFRERQGAPQPQRPPVSALGSGFVIDPSGYVVTNNHVVADAEEIAVTLHDGTRLPATLVGADPPTDLALLKVESSKPLTSTRWGDSDRLRVGDWLVAIGNPFGLGGTVTAGILSARARDIQQGPYDEYLQTDAPINRGNSGGPLFDTEGGVVGVNTAIYSPTGGSIGIGFAIPSALARPIIEELREHGQVRRGWLGVQVQRVTPDIAETLGMAEPDGALVTALTSGGPAEAAGVRQGDVIIGFDGHAVDKMRDLPRIVARTPIGKSVPLELLRNGDNQTLTVTVGRLEPEQQVAAGSSGPTTGAPPTAPQTSRTLGLSLSPLTPELRETFAIGPETQGVVITEVDGDSAASNRGIDAGDVIVEAGQQPVGDPEQVQERVEEAKREGRRSVLMLIDRQGELRYVPVPVEGGPG
ncbi:DegQ family serine endoprotease [Azospirillum sp. RWY-5-1]|uniref:Probable periplasmic serine endoprotease DegP-like n=1 Tax=Azospirillum oleiclasticum TaxID=2735135 RepID=A0ABX2T3H8_9PROT|nr:DegQ family serine endoprotease [Azospirillum oleiclasticum]NYZ11693.1 DegQ family serine endoprotease [Azospirillum oleiclasticum]NYZ18854.1 DegQ family serine endoprotease [Azospirillum oleiclasticum]